MRILPWCGVVLMVAGCHRQCIADPCTPPCGNPCTIEKCETAGPETCTTDAPCPRPCEKPAGDIRVKAPPQKIIIQQPCPTVVQAAAPQAAVQAAPQAMPMMVQAAPQMAFASSAPISPALPAIGIDVIRIPIPFLRLFAVPTTPTMTVPVATTYAAPQAMYAQPAMAAPAMAAPMMVPAQMVPAPAQAMVPVQAAQPAAAVCPPCPPCPTNGRSAEYEALNQQIRALEAMLENATRANTPSKK